MNGLRSLTDCREIVGEEKVSEIYQKAGDLCDKRVLNVNSTYYGGGVAATLKSLVPLLNDAGISVDWRTVRGSRDFFRVTKKFHNALQGEEGMEKEKNKKMRGEVFSFFVVFDRFFADMSAARN